MCDACIADDLTEKGLGMVGDEMDRQMEKWGVQNHPLIGGGYNQALYEYSEKTMKNLNEENVKRGTLGWDGILLEEVYEALAADTVDEQIEELVQVAAVAMSAVVSLRRNA